MQPEEFGERLQLGAVVQQLIENLKRGEENAALMKNCMECDGAGMILTLHRDGRKYRLTVEPGKKDDE